MLKTRGVTGSLTTTPVSPVRPADVKPDAAERQLLHGHEENHVVDGHPARGGALHHLSILGRIGAKIV